MQIIDFSREHASPIELFDSIAVSNVRIGGGLGEAHVYCVYFKAGGSIGEHPAGYAQTCESGGCLPTRGAMSPVRPPISIFTM
jgi:hypothetical protein